MSYELSKMVSSNSTSAMIAAQLVPYITSASASAQFVTSNSLSAALVPYLTSNSFSLATANFISSNSASAMVAAQLVPYVTSNSLSAVLAAYLTSNSASAALATKQDKILFRDEGSALSTTGAASIVNFTGTGVSASLTGGLLTVTIDAGAGGGEGSVSVSSMITAALAPYMTSNSVSAAVTTDVLVVNGTTTLSGSVVCNTTLRVAAGGDLNCAGPAAFAATATFSATAAFISRPLLEGKSFGHVLLGEVNSSGNSIRFSGSWTSVAAFYLHAAIKNSGGSGTASVAIYTDGGTTPILSLINGASVSAAVYNLFRCDIMAGTSIKSLSVDKTFVTTQTVAHTATANTGFINCIQLAVGASQTLSARVAQLWGYMR